MSTASGRPGSRGLAARRPAGFGGRAARLARTVPASAAILGVLVLLAGWTWTRELRASLWVDEGISVGIASHHLSAIPHLLREDGSPPLYYLLLHGWMAVVGDGEARTHALSVLLALLTIPAALWAGWSLAGRRVGWTCAVLAAVSPFLTVYAQETRMYSLVVLLGVLASACYVHAFVLGRRRYLAPFAVLLAALLYAHNWAIFFTIAALAGLLPSLLRGGDRRRLLLDAGLGFGGAVILYAPWIPTLLYQVQHTGAPWSRAPSPSAVSGGLAFMFGNGGWVALLLGAGAGLAAVWRRRERGELEMAAALAVLAVGTFALTYVASHVSPAWADRYLAIVLPPLLILGGLGVARAGGLGIAALVLLAVWGWAFPTQIPNKSNAKEIAREVSPHLTAGDLVITTQPEQVAVLHYYLPAGLRYADPRGVVHDPRVMDWRDALSELRHSRVPGSLSVALRRVPPRGHVLLVVPARSGGTPWANLIRRRSVQWRVALGRMHDLRQVLVARHHHRAIAYSALRAVLYTRR